MPKNPHANFSPVLDGYSGIGAFRFWCQTALPLTYDDSLSYYELLNKVVNYLNHTIEDLTAVESNTSALAEAYDKLQKYVNDYFDDLDVEAELRNVLDAMAEDGTLDALLDPLVKNQLPGVVDEKIDAVVAEQIDGAVAGQIDESVADQLPALVDAGIPGEVSDWLKENVDPVGSAVMVDSSLTISGAAADAKVTGDELSDLKTQLKYDRQAVSADFVQGYINSVGLQQPSEKTVTTTNYLDDMIGVTSEDNYKMILYGFNSNFGFLGYYTTNNTFSTSGTPQEFNNITLKNYTPAHFKVAVIAYSDNERVNITPENAAENVLFTNYIKEKVEKNTTDIEHLNTKLNRVIDVNELEFSETAKSTDFIQGYITQNGVQQSTRVVVSAKYLSKDNLSQIKSNNNCVMIIYGFSSQSQSGFLGYYTTSGTFSTAGTAVEFTEINLDNYDVAYIRIGVIKYSGDERIDITPASISNDIEFVYSTNATSARIDAIDTKVNNNINILNDITSWDNRPTWWNSGFYNYITGIRSNLDTRLCTTWAFSYPDVMFVKTTGDYEFSVLLYDENDEYQGVVNNNGGYSKGTDVKWHTSFNLSEYKQFKYKINVRNSSDVSEPIDKVDFVKNFFFGTNKKHELNILFIGNSLTQDGIAYLPYVLRNYYPEIGFHIYMWYIGGYDMGQQYSAFVNERTADIMSYAENDEKWINLNNSRTIDSVLSYYKFDTVCMQEYFNHKTTFVESNLQDWNNCKTYIQSHYLGGNPLKFVSLFHAPKRSDATQIFDLTKTGNALILQKTICEDMIPNGIAVYRALSTSLDALGDQGHLSNDGVHTQEGLPCLLQTYATLLWLFDKFSINKSIYGIPMKMTATIYNTLNVPGANLGTGVIPGTDAENLLAQEVAIKAFKEGKQFVVDNLYSAT